MGHPAVYVQTAVRLAEIALSAFALRYFAEHGCAEWFWATVASSLSGPLAAVCATAILLRESFLARRVPGVGCRLCGFALAHGVLCGDLWWFYRLVIADVGAVSYSREYSLSRLIMGSATSAPLLLVSASAFWATSDVAPGLCALTSVATVAITWSFYPEYAAALTTRRRWSLCLLSVCAKVCIVLPRFSALARVATSVQRLGILAVALAARFVLFVLWLRGRNSSRADGSRFSMVQLIKAAAYSVDLLMQPEECPLSLIAGYYSIMLMENCALTAAWYSVDTASVTSGRLWWLVCDCASFSLGLLLTVTHYNLAKEAGGVRKISHHMVPPERPSDVTPAADDYEWDPYDGDIRRRISYTNVAFEAECKQQPPLAVVLPYSGFEAVDPLFMIRAGGSLLKESSESLPEVASPVSLTSAVDNVDISEGSDSSSAENQRPNSPQLAAQECLQESPTAVSNDSRRLTTRNTLLPEGKLEARFSERHPPAGYYDKKSTFDASECWNLKPDAAYLNQGFVDDEDSGMQRYMPQAPRSVFTAKWRSASYGLSAGRVIGVLGTSRTAVAEQEARSSLTLPNIGRNPNLREQQRCAHRRLSGGADRLPGVSGSSPEQKAGCQSSPSDSGQGSSQEAGGVPTNQVTPAEHQPELSPRLRGADGAVAPREGTAQSERQWVGRWLQQIIADSKIRAVYSTAANQTADTYF